MSSCKMSEKKSGGPVIIAAKIFVKSECVDDFKKLAEPLIVATRQEKGCIQYELYQCSSDSTVFFFYEVYADKAAQELHSGSGYLATFSELRKDMLSKPSEVTIYDVAGVR